MFKLFPVSKNQGSRTHFLKDRFAQPKSFISIFLTIVFSATTITGNDMAWAQSASAGSLIEVKNMISQGQVPSDMGIVRDYAYNAANSQHPFVVHIQDAHSNVDAQKNIHQLLSWIHQKNNIVIGLEGAVDEIRPEYLEFFPEYPEANEAVVENLLQKGEINGTELFAWEQYKKKTASNNYRIVAAEDVELYAENLQNFRELSFQQDEIAIVLQKHRKNLELAKSRIFNAQLNEFLKERDRRKNGNYSTDTTSPQLSAYLSYLSSTVSSELGVNLDHAFEQVRFPNMVRVIVLAEIENALSLRQALSEKEEVLKLMKKKVKGKEALAAIAELEALDRGMAARQVVEKVWSLSALENLDLNQYSQYKTYLGSLVLNSEVEAEGLFEEMAILEHWLLDHWSPSQDEKKLVTIVENFDAMEKLLTLRWTTDDLANYKRNEAQVSASFLGNEIATLANKFSFNEYITKNELKEKEKNLLTAWVNQAINFYEVALERDEALLEKTLAAAKKDSVAVIVSGGYHTDGLVSRMRAKEMNYAVIQPVILKNDGGVLYHKALKDENADVSNYFNANVLNKQEALYFKELMEVAAPKLWDAYQVPHNELGEKISHVLNTHEVLSKKIKATSEKQKTASKVDFMASTEGNEVVGIGNNAVALTPITTESTKFENAYRSVATRKPFSIFDDDDDEELPIVASGTTVFRAAGVTVTSSPRGTVDPRGNALDANQFAQRAELRTADFNAFEGDDLIKNLAALNEAIADPKNGAEKEALENLRKGKYTTAVVATLKELSMNMMSHYPGQWEMMGAVARAAGDENLHHRFNKLPIPIIRHIVTNDLWASVVADKEVANLIWRELEKFRNDMSNETTWVSENAPELADKNIFYFSAEYGNQLFSYTGGLGILAGDHLRGMSDLGMTNFRAIGLLYQFGYFEQRIEGGRQTVDTEYTGINREDLPLIAAKTADGKDLIIDIPMVGKTVKAKVWKATHGKREVYMLDTRLEENNEEDRNITDRAYHSGGGSPQRMEQYYVLGVGGAMAMEALGVKPDVIHSNDSHPFFTIIREIAMQMKELEEQISDQETRFNKALKTVSAKTVFTTHTPIEAGNEIVSQSVLRPFLEEIFDGNAYAVERILSMGAKFDTETSLFNPKYFRITNFQMNVAAGINGVSKLHGAVSQKLNKAIFPGDPADEVDILGIVNSVHAPFWQQPAIAALFEETLSDPEVQALIRMDLKAMGEKLADKEWVAKHIRVDSAELDEVKRGLAKKLFEEIKFRARGSDVDLASDLEADALTIGFARRFIEYKRALLIFKDIPRLKAVAKKANKPIQLIFAGKAHPDDKDSQKILEQLLKYAAELNQEGTNIKVVFVENYNIELARPLESGTDAWLNTPIVGEEASGTSGPKAGLNGGINISTKDGWNIEGIVDDVNGYLFGVDSGERDDEEDARQLYDVIEEVIRLYDTPGREEWLEKVKAAVLMSVYRFGMERMLSAYATQLYAPASTNKPGDERQEAAIRQQFLAYSRKNNETNPIKIENFPATIAANTPTAFDLTADLSGLDPKDVGLDVMIRRQGQTWQWFGAGNPVATLEGENYRYQAIVNLPKAGEYEVKIRLTPRNQTAWKNTDEHNFVTRYYEAPNRLEVLDRRLVEARAKSSIEKGFLFSVQLPSLPQGTEVFWESLATAWQERAVKMNDLKDGFYTVVIPAETTGSGYHEFKMFTRSPDGTVNWFTGNYPVAADTNAYVTIPHANDPATANNPLFDQAAAQRILNLAVDPKTPRNELRTVEFNDYSSVDAFRRYMKEDRMPELVAAYPELVGLYQDYLSAFKAKDNDKVKFLDKQINVILDKFNAVKSAGIYEDHVGAFDLEKLNQADLNEIKTNYPESDQRRIDELIVSGGYAPEFFAAGAASRLGLGNMFTLSLPEFEEVLRGDKTLDGLNADQRLAIADRVKTIREEFPEYAEMPLGVRLLLNFKADVIDAVRRLNPSATQSEIDQALSNQSFSFLLNEAVADDVIQLFIDNDFFGFNRENVFFTVQPPFSGYEISGQSEITERVDQEKVVNGHGYPTMQKFFAGQAFTINDRGERVVLDRPLTDELIDRNVKLLGIYRINDLSNYEFGNDAVVGNALDTNTLIASVEVLGGFDHLDDVTVGADQTVELVDNPEKQKGGLFPATPKLKAEGFGVMPDTLAFKDADSVASVSRIEEEIGRGLPYNAMRQVYKLASLRSDNSALKGIPAYIRFRGFSAGEPSLFAAETVTGDTTFFLKTAAVSMPGRVIRDFKTAPGIGDLVERFATQNTRLSALGILGVRNELRSVSALDSQYLDLENGVRPGDIRKLLVDLEAAARRYPGVEVSQPIENEIRVRLPQKDGVTSVIDIARRDDGDRLQISLSETVEGSPKHSLDLHLSYGDSILRAYEGIGALTHLAQDETTSYLGVDLQDFRTIHLIADENGLPKIEVLFNVGPSRLPLDLSSATIRAFRANGFALNAFGTESLLRAELRAKLEKNPILKKMAENLGVGLLLLVSVTAAVYYVTSTNQLKKDWTPPTLNLNINEEVANAIFADLISDTKEVRELAAKRLATTSSFMQEAILIRLSVANTSSYYSLLSERAGIGAFSEEERNDLQRVEATTRRALDDLILNFGQFERLEGLGREKGGREVVSLYTAQVEKGNPIGNFELQLSSAEKVSEKIAVIRGLEYVTEESAVIRAVGILERLRKEEQRFIEGWKAISEEGPITTATMLAIEEVLPKLQDKLKVLQAGRNELRSTEKSALPETSALPVEVFEKYKADLKASITDDMAVDYQELDANTITLTFQDTMEVITINREEQGGSLSMTLLKGRDRATLYLVASMDLGRNSSFSVSSNGKPIHTLSSSRIKVNLDVLQGFALTDPVGQGAKLVVSFNSEEKNLPINKENSLGYSEGIVDVSKISFSSTEKLTRNELRFALTEAVATDDVIARIKPLVQAVLEQSSFRLSDSSSRIAVIASGIYATASDIASRNQVSEDVAMAALISELLDLKAENPAKLAAAIDLINVEMGPEFAAIFSALTADGSVAPTFTATLAELQTEEVQLATAFILRANPNNSIRFIVVDDDDDDKAPKYKDVSDRVADILSGLRTSTKDLANRLQIQVIKGQDRDLRVALHAAVDKARDIKNSRGFVVTENATALKTLPKFVEVSFGDRSSMKLATTILLTPAMSGNSLDQGVVAMLAHFESRGFDMTTLGQQISNFLKGLRKLATSA